MGANWARVHTWDGSKWKFSSDWLQADESILKPMVKAAADKYAVERRRSSRVAPPKTACQPLSDPERAPRW